MRFSRAAEQIRTALKSDGVLMGDMCLTSKMAQSIELWTALFEDEAPGSTRLRKVWDWLQRSPLKWPD